MNYVKRVREFREKIGLPIGDKPQLLNATASSFYARFLMEELSEFLKAHEEENLVDAADAVADLLYITIGMSQHMGLPIDKIFAVVHNANMQKTAGQTKRGGVTADASKPVDWVPPEQNIKQILNNMI